MLRLAIWLRFVGMGSFGNIVVNLSLAGVYVSMSDFELRVSSDFGSSELGFPYWVRLERKRSRSGVGSFRNFHRVPCATPLPVRGQGVRVASFRNFITLNLEPRNLELRASGGFVW